MMDLSALNEQQKEAVLSDSKRILVLAGAGSGKTHTVISRIIRLVNDCGVDPGSILALTFSNKAANGMKERILAGLDVDGDRIFAKTFHKLGSYILRLYGGLLGIDGFNIYTDDDSADLLKTCYPDMLKKDLKVIASSILDAKDRGYSSENYMEWEDAKEDYAGYFRKYEEALSRTGCVDFPDLINLSCRMLEENEQIRDELRSRWKFVFVDEYQDTNRMQFKLLEQLVGGDNHLCAVGDDDQSIYAFRGAENKHILDFQSTFPDAHVVKLEQNYRSTKRILSLSNSLIKENEKRNDKVLWTQNPEGETPKLLIYADNREEERLTARMAAELIGQGTVCIIYRNNAQSSGFESALLEKGVPCCIFKGDSFFSKEEIKDCLAYFSLALNSKDLSNFLRILSKPPKGIGKKTADAMMLDLLSCDGSVLDAALAFDGLRPSQRNELERLSRLVAEANAALAEHDAETFCNKLIIDSGLLKMYEDDNKTSFDSDLRKNEILGEAPRQSNIRTFLQMIKDNGGIRDASSFRAYLEGISLASQTDVPKTNGVVLSSMHSAKGLEFDTCFVTGLENEIIHSYRGSDIEEERRLLYVAMTRAKKHLYLSYSENRFRNGMYSSATPSRFIDDFADGRYEVKNVGDVYRSYRSGRTAYGRSYSRQERHSSHSSSGWHKGVGQSGGMSHASESAAKTRQELIGKSLVIKRNSAAKSDFYEVGEEIENTKTSQTGKVTGIRRLGEHVVID
ncbi:MAG TPA: hypothetical protein DCO86_05510, partial [Spirochaetaceae bacterium]|nr:hypothetical protein [Spirochaetaceae bacterium]